MWLSSTGRLLRDWRTRTVCISHICIHTQKYIDSTWTIFQRIRNINYENTQTKKLSDDLNWKPQHGFLGIATSSIHPVASYPPRQKNITLLTTSAQYFNNDNWRRHTSFSAFAWNVFLSCDEILLHDGYIKNAIFPSTSYEGMSELI